MGTLLGLNPPIGHAVQVIQHEPLEKTTSLHRIHAALDRICGKVRPDEPEDSEPSKPH